MPGWRERRELQAVLGADVSFDDGQALEAVVGASHRARGWRVAVAESCTGGLVSSRLTDVPGSSAYMDRGVVCYSNRAKADLAGVPAPVIQEHGAVSEPVAIAMAAGIRLRARVEVGLGITGIAGPSGGSDAKPVGTVVVAAVFPDGQEVRTHRYLGDRAQVKFQSSGRVGPAERHLRGRPCGCSRRSIWRLDRRAMTRSNAWPAALAGSAGGHGRVSGVREENLHLTMRFLGETADSRIGDLVTRFGAPLAALAFDIELGGVGVFPPAGPPRVVWIGVTRGVEPLVALSAEVERRFVAWGFGREDRPFQAHLTIGRCKDPLDPQARDRLVEAGAGSLGSSRVEEVVLYQSRLSASGPTYIALARSPLST
jgi:2'-5' RNA ligase